MNRLMKCKVCGAEFMTKNNHHFYCSYDCRRVADRERYRKKIKAPERTYPDIYEIVDAMLKLSKKRGHTVQYGEVQRDIITGRIKVKSGVIEC